MIPELGQLLLSLAFILALVLGTLPLIGAQRHISLWITLARPLSHLHTLALLGAFGLLTTSFLTHDFSVAYVAHNANTQQPPPYLISAVWGAHEGSLLLWALILALWTSAVSRFSRQIPEPMLARILSVLGLVSVGFLAFMLFTSNPFARLVPAAIEDVITKENADKIKAKMIVEGANGPTSAKADAILNEKGILAVPDILANAGGVTVSYFEWVQNRLGYGWTRERVSRRSDRIMKTAFDKVYATAKEYDVSMRIAAYIVAIDKVAKTYKYRGGF